MSTTSTLPPISVTLSSYQQFSNPSYSPVTNYNFYGQSLRHSSPALMVQAKTLLVLEESWRFSRSKAPDSTPKPKGSFVASTWFAPLIMRFRLDSPFDSRKFVARHPWGYPWVEPWKRCRGVRRPLFFSTRREDRGSVKRFFQGKWWLLLPLADSLLSFSAPCINP